MRKKNLSQLFHLLLFLIVVLPLIASADTSVFRAGGRTQPTTLPFIEGDLDSVLAAATVLPASITFSCDKSMQTFRIDNKGTGLKWKVKVASNSILWLDISESTKRFTRFPNEGTESQTLYLHIRENSNDTIRNTHVTLSREGMKDIIIPVTQMAYRPYIPSPHKGWAGCNVYWDPDFLNRDGSKGRLTFDDVGVTTHEDYQGLFFDWGSLVAWSPIPFDYKERVIFSPNPIPLKVELEYDNHFIFRSYTRERADAHYLLQMHNPKKSLGDICKYITDRGWAPGAKNGKKWRIPTLKEFGNAKNYTVKAPRLDTCEDPYGRHRLPRGLFTLHPSGVSFPRNGVDTGAQPGKTGVYITASPNDGTYIREGIYFGIGGYGDVERLVGMQCECGAVRCVLE